MKIKQDDGTEIEVFTQDEFDAKSKEIAEEAGKKAVEAFKEQNPDRSKEVDDLKGNLKKAEEDLAKAIKDGGNEEQIKRLRNERDEAERKANDGVAKIQKDLEDFKKEFIGDTKEEILSKLSKGDAELRKKIELEFDKYNPTDNSKKGIMERMAAAYNIVTGTRPAPNFMDNLSNAGDRGHGGSGAKGDKIERTDNEVKIGKTLGVTDADVENYEKFKSGKTQ